MRNATTAAGQVIRISGLVLVALGLIIWTGRADGLIPVHLLIGIVLVVALWFLALAAYRAGVRPGIVGLAVAWSLVMPSFGIAQAGLASGSLHVVVEIAHLVIGIVAIGLGEAMGGAIRSADRRAVHGARRAAR